jgi:hypothetical protein
MQADERVLAGQRLQQIADEVGVELSPERLEQLLSLLESIVEGARSATDLDLDDTPPAFVPDVDLEERP